MNKNFKIIAIVIIAFGGLLFMRERKLISAEKEMSKKYADERTQAQQKAAGKFAASESKITQNEAGINQCLAKVKPVKMQIVQEETDILIASIKALSDGKKDSAERVAGGDKAVLNKLNRQNTIIIYFNKLENQQLALAQNLKEILDGNSVYSSKIGTYTDLDAANRELALSRAAAVQYIVVVQPEKLKRGKIIKSEEFEPGYMIMDYEVYDISAGNKIKTSTLLATNSESLYTMNSTDTDVMLYNDLLRQGNRAVIKTIFGITN